MAEAGERIDTATVLFTDLVGSTAQRSRIGEEAADVLRVKHDTLITDAITILRIRSRSLLRGLGPLSGSRRLLQNGAVRARRGRGNHLR